MNIFISLSILSLTSVASKQWALDTATTATVLVGVGSTDADSLKGIVAAASNGVGAFVEHFDGSSWEKKALQAGLLLDSAATKSGKLRVVTSTAKVFFSNDSGDSYSTVENLIGTSQSANIFGVEKESIALVGGWVTKKSENIKSSAGSVNGVAFSTDGGVTFSLSAVPAGSTRYGAFPTEDTWYVSSGMWGDDPKAAIKDSHAHSSRISIASDGSILLKDFEKRIPKVKAAGEPTGWFGSVSKTTDGGKTWSVVLSTDLENDYVYFNGISCFNTLQCVVVGEGDDSTGAPLTVAYTTFDGGVTWEKTLTTTDVGLIGAKFISESEVWLLGSASSRVQIFGQFWKSTNGGKSFELVQSLSNCFSIDLDMNFDGSTGLAACSSSSGSSCSAAVYK